jgi:hypothetical protein
MSMDTDQKHAELLPEYVLSIELGGHLKSVRFNMIKIPEFDLIGLFLQPSETMRFLSCILDITLVILTGSISF